MLKSWLKCMIFLIAPLVFAQEEINKYDANGKRHGTWRKTFEGSDQVRYEGTFEHGKEKGLFKFYKKDSEEQPAATKMFREGSNLVEVKFYTKEGALVSEGKMKDEDRHGKWTYYHHDSDQIMMIENYVNDILEGKKTVYFENGVLAEEENYKNGKLHGSNKIYSNNGPIIKEFTYENGVLHGPVKYYDTEGNLEIEGQYKNDLRDGNWKYYQNGKLTETKKYPEEFRNNKQK